MKPATRSRRLQADTKLVVIGSNESTVTTLGHLGDWLEAGDVLLVNTSSTLPSSFRGLVRGREIDLRLAAFRGSDPTDLSRWAAVSFGEGDWRQPTEARGVPPSLIPEDSVFIAPDLSARILAVDTAAPRLVELAFESPRLLNALYARGRPIQYSHLKDDLEVWDQQTAFSGPPLSVEPPSASFGMTWGQLFALQSRGVVIAPLIHSAGLSSTGDPALDRRLPLAEYFEVPETTRRRVDRARMQGRRIVALGTTAARAIESAYDQDQTGGYRSSGYTSLRLGGGRPPRVANGLITGMHDDGTSHAELMRGFASRAALAAAACAADSAGFRSHEYGDLAFIDARGGHGRPARLLRFAI